MTPARFARLESSLNGTARKVLSAVPLQEPWSKEQIMSELRRQGASISPDAIVGSLNFITDRGLIKEAERGKFIRVQARVIENQPEPEEMQAERPLNPVLSIKQAAKVGSPKADVLTRLADLAAQLRTTASEIDAVALDVEERFASIQKDTEKMRQLTDLLKSIGGS